MDPGDPFLVLTPGLVIVGASDAYLRATLARPDDVRGHSIFDVFPDNPRDPAADGVRNLRDSLGRVVRHGEPDRMPTQRYDVRDRLAGDGAWVEKFWAPINTPVFGSGSREVTHVVHRVTDVSEAVYQQRRVAEEADAVAEQLDTLERMRQDLVRRQREAGAAWDALADMLVIGRVDERAVAALRRRLGSPPGRRYWPAGDHAPVDGIYELAHDPTCWLNLRNVFLRAGQPFRRCLGCRGDVFYRLTTLV